MPNKYYKPVHYDELKKDMVVYIKRKDGTIEYVDYNLNYHTTDNKIPVHHKHVYQLVDGYSCDENGLTDYMHNLKRNIKEMFCESKLIFGKGLLYTQGFSHHNSTMEIFKQITDPTLYNYIEHPDLIESKWMEANYNGGLQYCNPPREQSSLVETASPNIAQSYSYDYKSHYPTCLIDRAFYISSKRGSECIIDKIPDELYMGYGYFRCKIICTDPNIKKVFSFSSEHIYTDIMIMFAYELKSKFDISIELIKDGKPNAYVYDADNIIQTRDIFIKHNHQLSELRKKHPKNRLFKYCLSSLWGCLCQANKKTRTEIQLKEQNIDYDYFDAEYIIKDVGYNADGSEYFEIINQAQPYLHNLSRIKAYLASFTRIKTARLALKNLGQVIRIHTDCVTFTEPLKNCENGLCIENKSTGLIKWSNVNEYEKIEE
jgi:hypothetical protein